MSLRSAVTKSVSQIWWGVNISVFYTYTPPAGADLRQYVMLKGLDNNAPNMILNFTCDQTYTTATSFTYKETKDCSNTDITTSTTKSFSPYTSAA
jgi:hypothetical protein